MSDIPTQELPALTAPSHVRPPWQKQPVVWLATGVMLAVLLLGWQLWRTSDRVEATREELARRLNDSDAVQREARANARQNREALDALQAKVGAVEARQAEMQGQQLALEAMYQELSRVRDDRLVAEIEQAVSIAAQQLQLAGNVEAALIALQGAEARLAKNAQPQFIALRKLVARDIERLKALPGADVSGIALKLDSMLNVVANLPLAFEQRPAPKLRPPSPTPSGGEPAGAASPTLTVTDMLRDWLADLWQETRRLIRIERIDRPDPGLLAPREVFFLRENLRLRLLSARLALLARDGRSFRNDLQQSGEWIEHYFDVRAPAVQEVLVTLKALGKLDVVRETAELNETLAALRNFKLARERSPTR